MKPKFRSLIAAFAPLSRSSLIVVASLCAVASANADQTWTGATDALWTTGGNWTTASPGVSDVAIFDAASTANLATTLGANTSVLGLKVVSPTGAVSVATGNTLTLGSAGIDMSAATQNLSLACPVALLGANRQVWSVGGTGGNLSFSGSVTAAAGSALLCDVTAPGTISMTAGTANSLFGTYATYGNSDWAAKDVTNAALVGGNTVSGFYTVNVTGSAQAISGNMDMAVYNTGWTGGQVRTGTNYTVTSMRFNGGTGGGATGVEIKSGTAITVPAILVTPNYGAKNVNITTGGLRPNSGGSLYIHQHNTAGDLVFNSGITAQGTNTLIKTGAGKAIVIGNDNLTGTHTILQGTYQLGNGGASGGMGSTTAAVVNHANVAFNRSDAPVFPNPISGNGSVTMAGSGALTLSGTNTYSGGTNLNAGTLVLTDVNDLGTGTALNFNGGTLRWSGINTDISASFNLTLNAGGAGLDTNGNDVTFANPVGNSGTGGIVKKGAGTLTLAEANLFSGDSTVSVGKLVVSNTAGSATGSGAVNVSAGGILAGTGVIAGTVNVALGGVIQPGASVGEITVGGLNLVTGSVVNVEFGTGNDQVDVTATNGLTLNGGTINLYQDGTTTPFTATGTYDLITFQGAVQGSGVPSLVIGNPQPGIDYSLNVVGNVLKLTIAPGGLISHWIEDGGGDWTDTGSWSSTVPGVQGDSALFDTNLLSGPATINLNASRTVGSVFFDSAANSYTLAPGTVGSLVFDNDTDDSVLNVLAGVHFITAPVSFTSNLSVLTATPSDAVTLSGGISGAGGLAMNGPGTLLLSGANTGTGGISMNNGTVDFGTGSLGSNNLDFDGGRLRWAAVNTDDISTAVMTFGTGGAILDTNGNDVVLANSVGNSGVGSLAKEGTGSLELASANDYSGSTSILGGSLVVPADASLGTVPGSPTTDSLVIGNGTLAVPASFTLSTNRGIALTNAASSISLASGATLSHGGTVAGAGKLNVSGSGGILALNGTKSYGGGTVVTDATVQSNTDLPSNITLNGTGALSFTGTRNVTGLTINGPDTAVTSTSAGVILTVASFTAGSGQVTLTNSYVTDFTGTWGTFGGTIKLNGPGGYRLNGTGGSGNVTVDLNGYGLSMRAGTTAVAIGALTGSAASVLAGPTNSAQTVTYTVGAKNVSTIYAGAITNSGGGGKAALTKTGTETLTLSGASTYTGDTRVSAGTLAVESTTALGSDVAGTIVDGNDVGSKVTITGGLTVTEPWTLGGRQGANASSPSIVSLAGNNILSGLVTPTTGGNNYNIESAAGTLKMAGDFVPTGSVTGPRYLQLLGAAPGEWSGSIQNGTATVFLNCKGTGTWTLSGNNTYTGDTVVDSGCSMVLFRDTSVTGHLKFAPGANNVCNKVTGAGTATLNGIFDIDLTAANLTTNNEWTLVDVASKTYGVDFAVDGFTKSGSIWTKVDGANTWTFSQTSGKLGLTIAAGFSSWATTHAGGGAATDDFDGDGVSNAAEWVLGGLETTNDLGKLPGVSTTGGNLIFTFVRDQQSISADTTVSIETSTDLAGWPNSYVVPDVATVGTVTVAKDTAPGKDTVTLTVPQAPDAKKFAHLKVVITP
jgi:autotransporter-associated beta strand protein